MFGVVRKLRAVGLVGGGQEEDGIFWEGGRKRGVQPGPV